MNRLKRCAGMLLVCALLAPAMADARPKPLDPVTVHARIAKRGVGNWICVEEANGIALVGRVVSVGDESVGLQLQNYPEVTPVLYTDIVGLRMGLSRRAMWTMVGVGLGLVGVMAAVGIHEVNQNKLPTNTGFPASITP
jgi:hypothetical protein